MRSPLTHLLRFHEAHEPGSNPAALATEDFQRIEARLHPRVAQRYRQALGRHRQTALAELDRNVCTGCFMRQPNNPVKLAEQFYSCQNCGRVLYDPNDACDLLVG